MMTSFVVIHNKCVITQLIETFRSIILIIALVIFIFIVTYYCVIRKMAAFHQWMLVDTILKDSWERSSVNRVIKFSWLAGYVVFVDEIALYGSFKIVPTYARFWIKTFDKQKYFWEKVFNFLKWATFRDIQNGRLVDPSMKTSNITNNRELSNNLRLVFKIISRLISHIIWPIY